MKLLALSEHYFPRVGGTVSYVHETLNAIVKLGIEVELIVPGPLSRDFIPQNTCYHLTALDAGYPMQGNPTAKQRREFCVKADAAVRKRLKGDSDSRPDLIHILFGLFLMEEIDTVCCQDLGVPVMATVHNLPPMECGRLLPNAVLCKKFKEVMRL